MALFKLDNSDNDNRIKIKVFCSKKGLVEVDLIYLLETVKKEIPELLKFIEQERKNE